MRSSVIRWTKNVFEYPKEQPKKKKMKEKLEKKNY